MNLILIFGISGAVIMLMLVAKRVQERHRRTFILLSMISRGDRRARDMSQYFAVLYAEGREWALFMVEKQLPMRIRSNFIKLSALAREAGAKYLQKIRDSKFLERREHGISAFFKSIKEVERGQGEIDEPWEDQKGK